MEVVESKALKSELSQTIVLLTKKVYVNVKIYKCNVYAYDRNEKWIAYCILMMIAWAFRLSFIYRWINMDNMTIMMIGTILIVI